MSEMIERVARAMCCARPCEGCRGSGEGGCFDLDLWAPEARAAIEAMREPSAEMLLAGRDDLAVGNQYRINSSKAEAVWQAMVSAALSPLPLEGD